MRTAKLRTTAVVALLLALVAAWATVIWVALQVSTTVLQTLDMIIDLAAISP